MLLIGLSTRARSRLTLMFIQQRRQRGLPLNWETSLRAAIGMAVFASSVVQAETNILTNPPPLPPRRELIRDPHFQQGFILLEPAAGKKVPYGELRPADRQEQPVWQMAQWSSKYPLAASATGQFAGGSLRWANAAKSVTLGQNGGAAADLALGVNASVEYGPRARRLNEPWVHLLVEQRFAQPPALADLTAAQLRVEARLLRSQLVKTDDYTPGLHAAQFQIFFTLQNSRSGSPGHGRYLWFGVPIYDDRQRLPAAHKSQDTAGTEMFIFTPGGEAFTSESAHDRQWITLDKDLLPLMHEALETAWQRGFLTESKSFADYCIGEMNMGWEVPGLFDVELQVRNLSLQVTPRAVLRP
ncbi:MAG: hypothetical protein V9H26_08035 [Verrucomicrobiota bacterium]